MRTLSFALMALAVVSFVGCRGSQAEPVAKPKPPAAAPAPVPSPAPVVPPANVTPPAQPKPPVNANVAPAPVKETPVTDEDLKKLLAGWKASQAECKTITAKFACSESLAILAKPRNSAGRIEIMKPSGYRRTTLDEKTGAVKGLLVLKSPDLWVYMPELKEVEHYDLARVSAKGGDSAASALEDVISFDAERLGKRFKISAVREGEVVRLELLPADGKEVGGVEKLRLWMKPNASFPEKMETFLAGGDSRVETYTETKVNEKLDESLFSFKAPSGVKVTEIVK